MGLWHCLGCRMRGLVSEEIHPSSGAYHLFLKEDKFHSDWLVSHWQQLVCPRSPLLLNGFQSSLISLESYFQGESNAICYEGQGLLLMEMSAITEIAPPRSSWSYLAYIQSGLILSGYFPLCLGVLLSFSIAGSHLWCGFQA